jgi:5-methylcytosine-specific restriction endonuclease McrA
MLFLVFQDWLWYHLPKSNFKFQKESSRNLKTIAPLGLLVVTEVCCRMRTLVLNSGYEPLFLTGWQRALILVLSDKAEVVQVNGAIIRTVSTHFAMPSVIRLNRYVKRYARTKTAKCNRINVFARDHGECQYCGVEVDHKMGSIDHVVPRSRGGRTSWHNVVLACQPCNHKKADMLPEECGLILRRKPRAPSWLDILHMHLSEEQRDLWSEYFFSTAEAI